MEPSTLKCLDFKPPIVYWEGGVDRPASIS